MNLKDLTNLQAIKAVFSKISIGEIFSYENIRQYFGLYLSKSGYYGTYDPITKETTALEISDTSFVSTTNINILIEGYINLPKTPAVSGGGSIVYNGYGVLEVNGVKIYDGRGDSVDLSGYLPKSAGSTQALTGDLYTNGTVRRIQLITDGADRPIARFNPGVGRVIYDLLDNPLLDIGLGFGIVGDGGYIRLKPPITGSGTAIFQPKDGFVALLSDIESLKGGVPVNGDTLNKLYNLIASRGTQIGPWDASGGTLPTIGSGPSTGEIRIGDYWDINVGGTISGLSPNPILRPGDILVANKDNASVASDFYAIQGNVDQATDTILGLVKLYTNLSASNIDGSVTQAALKTTIDAINLLLTPPSPGIDAVPYYLKIVDDVKSYEPLVDVNGTPTAAKDKLQANDADWVDDFYVGGTSGAITGTKGGEIFWGNQITPASSYAYFALGDNVWYRIYRG